MSPDKQSESDPLESLSASIKKAQEAAQAAQQQILEGVMASQTQILESVRAWTKATEPARGQMPAAPAKDLQKLVDDTFDFHEKLLASQREFTHQLITASTPAGGKAGTTSNS